MECIAICCIGIEDVVSKDIKELINKQAKQKKGVCLFEANNQEIAKFSYICQSIEHCGIMLKHGKISEDPEEITIDDVKFPGFDNIDKAFTITCKIVGEHGFKSNDVVGCVSKKIKSITKKEFSYKTWDARFHIYIVDDEFYLFSDLSKTELSKRDYKIFVNKTSLRGTIAYGVGKIADVKEEDKILDPFCRSGEIPIELCHSFCKKSLNFYTKEKFLFKNLGIDVDFAKWDNAIDNKSEFEIFAIDSNMANLKAAEKNSKIANLHKKINFSRVVVDDLDLKFDHDIDKIVTQLPAIGAESEKKVLSCYTSFFRISREVLKKDGIIACVGLNIEKAVELASGFGFKLKSSREVMQGKETLKLLIFNNTN